MIRLKRDRSASKIPRSFRGDKPVERLIELMEVQREIKRGNVAKHSFSSKWGVAKEQLQAETHGKCAYCEATTTESMHGDVEHYRPKSKYWWLAYVYDNYLASCQLCNQAHKSDNFEVAANSVTMKAPSIRRNTTDSRIATLAKTAIPDPLDAPAVGKFENAHRSERPLILNPYIDDPDEVFAWKAIDGIREVWLVPKAGNPDASAYVDAADRLLGLNREELRERRYAVYSNYKLFAKIRDDTALPPPLRTQAAQQITSNFTNAASPYAGMIRYFDSIT